MLYEGECVELDCGRFEDIVSLREYENHGLTCPTCGGGARTILHPIRTVGATSTRPVSMNQLGKEFTSNSEMRRYFAKHPGREVVDKSDREWTDHYDDVRNSCDAAARSEGYRDVRHKQQARKREKNREHVLKAGLDTPKVVR